MMENGKNIKNVYLCAWLDMTEEIPHAAFQVSTVQKFREENVIFAGIKRKNTYVTVYSDHAHGIDYLKPDELRLVARHYLSNILKVQ